MGSFSVGNQVQPVRLFLSTIVAISCAAIASAAHAQETAAYPNGTSGIKAGSVPPKGHYWLMYDRLYQANELVDAQGKTVTGPGGVPLGLDLSGFANVHRFVTVTDYQLLGADFAWNAVVPFVNIDLDIAAAGVHSQALRVGDINVEPFILEWRAPQYDFGFVYGLFVPTADRKASYPALPGKGFWTHYVGLAGTYFFDEDRQLSLSALSRYEMCTERRDIEITPGNNFSFEWGLARNFNQVLDIGVSGYCSWQTSLDSGPGITYVNALGRANGIGPEIQYFSAKYKLGYHFRYWWEFGVRDQTRGTIATLTLVKPF
jgi:hypothetical protein